MPFTFSHPAAILPFVNSRSHLSLTGLVLGSIVPDLEFYFQLRLVENVGHGFWGIWWFDIPLAFALAFIFHGLVKVPLYQASPYWFRVKLADCLSPNWIFTISKRIHWLVLSILIGVLSHLFLDGLTHFDGWAVQLFPILGSMFSLFKLDFPAYEFLQYSFSLFGLMGVWIALKKKRPSMIIHKSQNGVTAFWYLAAIGFIITGSIRISLFPKFISFWDLFMMLVGAGMYGILIASITKQCLNLIKLKRDSHSSFKDSNFGELTVFSKKQKVAGLEIVGLSPFMKLIQRKLKLIGLGLLFLVSLKGFGQEGGLSLEKREVFLQEALQLRSEENYLEAISLLDSILVSNLKDSPILLLKGDICLQAKDFSQAADTYRLLIPLDFEKTIVRVNLSYALFMDRKPSLALQEAFQAWEGDRGNPTAVLNYFNALLWNVKTKEAESFLQENQFLVTEDQYLVMKARLFTTSGNYSKGQIFYDSLVNSFPQAPYIQEFSEVLIGKRQWGRAEQLIQENKEHLSSSQLEGLQGKLESGESHRAGFSWGYFSDLAKNTRTEQSVYYQSPVNASFRYGIRLGASLVKAPENQETKSSFAAVSAEQSWTQAWHSQAQVRIQKISPQNGEAYQGITGELETKFQPNDRRMVGVNYSSEILNFTASLLGKNIHLQNFGYVTHVMLDGKTGVFSQGSYGALNDGNSRIQFFGSLYRLLRTEPTLKTGLNFSALGYQVSTTDLYFAPEKFMSGELFLEYQSPRPMHSKLSYHIQGAGGIQQIENRGWDPSYRARVQLNYRIEGFDVGLNGQFSNVAASSGTGYQYHYFTFHLSRKF